jgi:sugar phosphate isomerase/epimerase
MVHFKDFLEVTSEYQGMSYTSLDGLRYKGVALGDGDVALQDCVDSLRAAGFEGWLNIEFDGEPDADTLPRCVEYARKVMGG